MRAKTPPLDEPPKNIERKLKRSVRKHQVKEWLLKEPINKYWVMMFVGLILWVCIAWLNAAIEIDAKLLGALASTAGLPTLVGFIGVLAHGVDW